MAMARDRVVVIGAGLGGLSSALRLAHAGLDVTVLERASHPGGKMRTLPSVAGPVDAGPTVLTLRPVFEALFADVGERLCDHVTLTAEPTLARHWWQDGSTLDLFSDAEASAAAIRAFAGPRAETEFRAFCARAARLYAAFDGPMMRNPAPTLARLTATVLRQPALIAAMAPHATLAASLARQFTDPRLRQIFGRYATYVGGSPYACPAVLGLIWHSEAQGVWRVQGGMHRLATAVAGLCAAKGATIRYGCHVARIEVQFGRTVAVILSDGARIPASHVVFNGDPAALAQGLLGQPARQALPATATAPRSLSACVWSFAATPAGPDLLHHNVFFGASAKSEFDDLAANRMPTDPTLYVCAQDRGDGPPSVVERFEIIQNAPPLSNPQPEAEPCNERTFRRLEQFGLTFSPGLMHLTTPDMFNQLFPGSAGSLYGRSPQGMMAAFQRPTARTKLPGLYLAGGGVHPGAGIPMATLSGQHAAAAILKDLALISPSRRMAMRGGMSTGSATMAAKPSASSAS